MEGLGLMRALDILGLLAFGIVIVIPVLVWRDYPAYMALGDLPLVAAAWTHTAGPKGVPHCSTTGYAFPAILGLWAPLA